MTRRVGKGEEEKKRKGREDRTGRSRPLQNLGAPISGSRLCSLLIQAGFPVIIVVHTVLCLCIVLIVMLISILISGIHTFGKECRSETQGNADDCDHT